EVAKTTPAEYRDRRQFSVAEYPELVDHCFFRQADGWPSLEDRCPVVPMTMSIALLVEAACALAPGKRVVGVEHVQAVRWLAVEPPVEADVRAALVEPDRVRVEIEGLAVGEVVFVEAYDQQ